MEIVEHVSSESLPAFISGYLEKHAESAESAAFEKTLEHSACARLLAFGQFGWDFETVCPFFGSRGTSVLIQNSALPWKNFWDWLQGECRGLPSGAIVNFEVYDHIRDGVMTWGATLSRHVITKQGIWSSGM